MAEAKLLGLIRRREHRHAAKRRLRRKIVQTVLFFVIIIAATFLLQMLFNFSTNYMPALNEPKDTDREKALQKEDKLISVPYSPPPPPQRGSDH